MAAAWSLRMGCGKAALVLLVALVPFQWVPHVIGNYALRATLKPFYKSAFGDQPRVSQVCAHWKIEADGDLSAGQRLAVGGILRSLGCTDLAAQILPEFTVTAERPGLLAYEWGLISWAQGDIRRAVGMWRQGRGIDQRLLIEARRLRQSNLDASQQWYEAAIMSADSPSMLAESITAYTEETRGQIASTVFREQLSYLEWYFGADTAIGYRLRGQRSLMGGSYRTAFEELSQAIALGMTDAETWYLLGDAAWSLNDLASTEDAYRRALDAPVQIAWRRPWHLNRLAVLLVATGRSLEALPFLEEAVRLSDYYSYSDNLAVLYKQLGENDKAQALCGKAHRLAGSAQQSLRCERP